jgi:hypothetical protein
MEEKFNGLKVWFLREFFSRNYQVSNPCANINL